MRSNPAGKGFDLRAGRQVCCLQGIFPAQVAGGTWGLLGGSKRQELHPTHTVLCPPQPCSVCSRDIPAWSHPSLWSAWGWLQVCISQISQLCPVLQAGSALSHCARQQGGIPSQETQTLHLLHSWNASKPTQSKVEEATAGLQEPEASLCLFLASFFNFCSPSSAEPKHFGDSALRASLLFTEPPISLLQDAAWIRPITSSLDV